MLGFMLAIATAAAAPSPAMIVKGSQGKRDDLRVLRIALSAPERPRRAGEIRFCSDDTITRRGTVRRVCRTRADWNDFGLDPVAPASLDRQFASN